MLEIKNLTKCFGETKAINDLSLSIEEGGVFGLVGSNGAGKSTLLRLLAGIYKPDSGTVSYSGEGVWENPKVKRKTAFVADELYLPPSHSINTMATLYKAAYEGFDTERLASLTEALKLNPRASFNSFSKGMRRQAATLLALCTTPDYLLLDETFDGLDIVMRGFVKQIIFDDIARRGTTVILSSHSLKELEDCCDRLALLHEGSVVLDSNATDLKNSYFKVQIAFDEYYGEERFAHLEIQSLKISGKVASFIIKGNKAETEEMLKAMNPILLDVLPLSLEEVFVCALSALGYEYGDTLIKN